MVDTPIGTNSPNYTPVSGDVGATIKCRVTASNAGGSAQAMSNTVGPVLIAAPLNTVAPAVTGTTTVGSSLACTQGTWTGAVSYTYQWVRLPSTNVGTNSPNYTLVAGDETFNIRCTVTATNTTGSTAANSNTVGPVVAADEAETTAWAAAVVTAGGTVSAGRKTLVNNLIAGLKTDGVWVKLDRIWLLAGENNQSARIDLKALGTCTVVGAPPFTVDRGYASVAPTASNYLNTNYTPTTNATNYLQNSACHFLYDRTSGTSSGFPMGTRTATPSQIMSDFSPCGAGASSSIFHMNTNPYGPIANPGGNTQGFWIVTRNVASGAGAVNVYKNGNSTPYGTSTGASGGRSNFPYIICGQNNNGTIGSGSTDQIACAGMGGGLNATQAVALSARINTYMTAIGANIY